MQITDSIPKITDPDGWSAYGLAATSGYHETIELLIKDGINPNSRNASGTTILMLACKSGSIPTMKY